MYVDAALALAGSISGNTITPANMFASGATVTSPNVVDLASQGIPSGQTREMGGGNDLTKLRVEIVTAFTGGTSVQFNLVTADDSGISTNVTIIGSSAVIPVAQAIVGARFEVEINTRILSKGQRYLAMQAVNVGANTTGAVYADLGDGIEDFKTYPVGFAVL
jgi:hypothetical protein